MQRRRKNGIKRRRTKRKRKTSRGRKNSIPLGKRKLNKISRHVERHLVSSTSRGLQVLKKTQLKTRDGAQGGM